jgi:glucose-6-phosphate isomerase
MVSESEGARPGLAVVDWMSGRLRGAGVQQSSKKLHQLKGIFQDAESWAAMDPEILVYEVQWIEPVVQGTEGGLFWGNSVIHPGRVGDEYFMTHGHFHAQANRAEFYATVAGQGMLILVDAQGHAQTEEMRPGSLHYVAGHIAHRVANTGDVPLRMIACWPSDAGHDYGSIKEHGMGARLICRDGVPVLVGERWSPER